MEPSHIKTIGDFREYLLLLANGKATTTSRSLEAYLRALWGLIQQAQAHQVTHALLGQLADDAFLAEPLPFDENWLQYDAPPHLHETDNAQTFSVLQHMICYQIADLHCMDQAHLLENKLRFFGIDSPTGYTWYNFDPSSYLECAARGVQEGVSPPTLIGSISLSCSG
jgi:hypothetical protein